jgi:hypothetical protein
MFSETDIIIMLDFLIDNIFVMFGGCLFQQIVGIPMATNCAPLLLIINGQENNNTKRKMASCVKVCYVFLKNIKPESGEIEIISPNELDLYLQEFFFGLRKEKSKRRKIK